MLQSFEDNDMKKDLQRMHRESSENRLDTGNPVDFLKWVQETLRRQNALFKDLSRRYDVLRGSSDEAKIGLKRLDSLISFKNQGVLDNLRDMHRAFDFRNNSIARTLGRCKESLYQANMNLQFVGETLKSSLADRHKKRGVSEELGLRLRDIDADLERCRKDVVIQEKEHNQLSQAIQQLLYQSKVGLPPKVQDSIVQEDKLQKMVADYQRKEGMLPPKKITTLSNTEETGDIMDNAAETTTEAFVNESTDFFSTPLGLAVCFSAGAVVGYSVMVVVDRVF